MGLFQYRLPKLGIGAGDSGRSSSQETERKKKSSVDAAVALLSPKGVAGSGTSTQAGRLSYDRPEDQYKSALGIFAKQASETLWRKLSLDSGTLDRMTPEKLMELLSDLSPEFSRALFDFVLMFNPGYELKAYKPGTETPDDAGQAVLDQALLTLSTNYGAPEVVFNRLAITAAIRGALFSEVVFNDAGELIDLATPDPQWVIMDRVDDPLRGVIYVPAQWQGGQLVQLTRITIRYIPIHPFPGNPYGRALFSSALFSAIFLLSLLHDLRRVIAQQGYPRLDLSIDFALLVEAMPQDLKEDPKAFQAWADEVTAEVAAVYGNLEPDQAYVHSSIVTVNNPKGALNAQSLGVVGELIKAIERMLTRALKTMPLLMATTDGVSEANANRQWEIHVAGIKSIQHLAENLLEYDLGLALRSAGVVADVRMRFSELRAAELFRDAQVGLLKATIARYCYDAGWISQDEAASLGADKPKADQPEPRTAAPKPSATPTGAAGASDPTGAGAGAGADPGANRLTDAVFSSALRLVTGTGRDTDRHVLRALLNLDGTRAPTLSELNSAVSEWKGVAASEAENLIEAEPLVS